MPLDLRDPLAKFWRADEHLETLDREMRAWAENHAYELSLDGDTTGREYVARLNIIEQTPTERWAVLASDVISNLRDCLDHLVMACAIFFGGEAMRENGSLCFPICNAEPDYRAAIKRGALDGVPDEIRAVIQSVQPYTAAEPPENTAFAILRDLSNVDKHRILHPVSFLLGDEGFVVERGAYRGEVTVTPEPGPYEHGAQIARLYFSEPNAHVEVQCALSICVAFERSPVKEDIREILAKIMKVIFLGVLAQAYWAATSEPAHVRE